MVFSSLVFLLGFLPALLLVYFLIPARFRGLRNLVLLGASLFFYWWGASKLVLLMVLSILVNYLGGLLAGQADRRLARFGVIFASVVGLGLLGWFKYAGFLAQTIHDLGFAIPIPQVTLPIGISFFTFQGLSYVIDVYRGDAPIQKNPLNVALYVALFPQLVAGPIVRYTTVMAEIAHREENLPEFASGVTRFCFGLAKKMVLANSMGQIADGVFNQTAANLDPGLAWVGALAYTFQIYFDFSAYSDMAIGLGKILGFHFPENFRYPYCAKSVTEFWRRWHITLGTWFRDYVYIPLGGNRVSRLRWVCNICLVWCLTGLWHGAGWNFLLWGLFYALLLLGEKLWYGAFLQRNPGIGHLYLLLSVVLGFVLFNAETLAQAFQDFKTMFGGSSLPFFSKESLYALRTNGVLLLFSILGATPLPARLYGRGKKVFQWMEPVLLALLLFICTAYLVDGSFNPFLYFRF